MIDPTLWSDEHFGRLSDKAKILFIACISNADDDGRLSAHTSNLRALAFRFDDLSLKKIQDLRDEIQREMVNFRVYPVNGCEYIQLDKWTEYQNIRSDRYKHSRLPDVNQVTTKCQPSDNQMSPKVKESKVNKSIYILDFSTIWDKYPNKDGKKSAERHFLATVKTKKDFADITKALDNYKKHLDCNDWKKPKNGSTWFNNWKDWTDWVEPKGKDEHDGIPKSLQRFTKSV